MAPASINHLPNEIHSEILKCLLSLSRLQPESAADVALEWIEEDTLSPSLFPFDAAKVCNLWYNILIRIPDCWTRVVFDVASDPTRFLDAFLWSKNLEKLQVEVFNSVADPAEAEQACEARRVAAIAQALQPHVHRCKSIIFYVTYSSSLPLPTMFFLKEAPHLEKLFLECEFDDITSEQTGAWTHPVSTGPDDETLPDSFPKLHVVSLTGYGFLYLALHRSQWLKRLRLGISAKLFVTRFTFLDRGLFTLPTLVHYLAETLAFEELFLSDLSLSYDHEDAPRRCDADVNIIACPDIHFQAVSKDFLSHFYTLADVNAYNSRSFKECQIPIIRRVQNGDILKLENIIDSDAQNGRSLFNILEVWSGSKLIIHDCPSFNDTILKWLGTEVEYAAVDLRDPFIKNDGVIHYSERFCATRKYTRTFPSETIAMLGIHNCPNFTSRGMREFIDTRNNASKVECERDPNQWDTDNAAVEYLRVTGRSPELAEEDENLYKENWPPLSVQWMTKAKKDSQ